MLGEVGDTLPDVAIDPDDDATIFYTSGTTGRSKGALGTQRNITTNPISLAYAMAAAGLRGGGRLEEVLAPTRRVSLLSVPFFHATGCHSVLVASALAGSTIVLMRKWVPERALELIERERVTTFGGVPTIAWQVLTSPHFDKYDTSSLTSVAYGGAPAPPALVEKIKELLPERIPGNGYGLTETSSVTTYNSGVNYLSHPDSVGPPVAVCDVKVVDRRVRNCRSARWASCSSRDRTSSAATGTVRTPPPRPSSAAGSTAATWRAWTTRGSCTSSTGPRTC